MAIFHQKDNTTSRSNERQDEHWRLDNHLLEVEVEMGTSNRCSRSRQMVPARDVMEPRTTRQPPHFTPKGGRQCKRWDDDITTFLTNHTHILPNDCPTEWLLVAQDAKLWQNLERLFVNYMD